MIPLRSSAAALRNRGPIGEVLARVLPPSGLVLEIASGTGEHAVAFAAVFPGLSWQPTERDEEWVQVIAARRELEGTANLLAPVVLDVMASPWPIARADAVVCINMIHISPWSATEALFRGAARVLPPGGLLYLYGPYRRGGAHTAPSNEAFDASLRTRDPSWGVRDLEAVLAEGEKNGLVLFEPDGIVAMPANNFSVVLRRT